MAKIIKEISLETSKPNIIQAIVAKQNDCNSRFLKVSIFNQGTQIPILPTSTVTINAERNDGESKSFLGEVQEDNAAVVPLHSWMLEREGLVNCDVSIIDAESSKLTTTSFSVMVEKAACPSEDISTDPEYDVLVELIEEVNDLKGDLSDVVKKTDLATNTELGLVKGTENGDYGIMISQNGEVQIRRATTEDINARKHTSRPIVPANLKQAVTSVFEDVYSDVYVKTGKLKSAVVSVLQSLNRWFWEGDEWEYEDGTSVPVSVENLENIKGEFVGQIIHIRGYDPTAFKVYMYLGLDVMDRHVWTKLGEVPD